METAGLSDLEDLTDLGLRSAASMRPSLPRILNGLYVQKLKYIPVTWKEVHLRGRPDAAVQRSPLLAPRKQGPRGRWRIKPPPSAGPPSARE